MKLIVAEKPSVARDIARVLGAGARERGSLAGSGWVVSWCVGHLVELDEPETYDAAWKRWSLATLPMLPERFRLRPRKDARDQWSALRELLRRRDFECVVNACDAGREGELIFRYCYELAGCRLPVSRLWISSLTETAIRAGFAALEPGARFDALADAARCRSEADWLVGLNATRAMTLVHRAGDERGVLSIGRVQTPTLAMLVRREEAIRAFVPEAYFELFADAEGPFSARWRSPEGSSRLAAEALARELEARVQRCLDADGGTLLVEDVREKRVVEAAPQLFDLTSLQRAANKRFGYSADRTLKIAQALYEEHKLITYPRTDAKVLGEDQRPEIPRLVEAVGALDAAYRPFADALLAAPLRITKRIVDDSKVGDHHAIIPTGRAVDLRRLDDGERRVFDLIARRLLACLSPDAVFAVTEVVLRAGPDAGGRVAARGGAEERERILKALPPPPDRFHARGRVRLEAGWQAVDGERGGERGERGEDAQPLPRLARGARVAAELRVAEGKTQPPRRHTDATLLSAMELAGREVDDEALRAAMKDSGLGTPATRAAIIETLIRRELVERQAKLLVPTERGMGLIAALPVPTLASPELTGSWEARLARIARGQERRADFMAAVAAFVREIVGTIAGSGPRGGAAAPRAARSRAAVPRDEERGARGGDGEDAYRLARAAVVKPGRRASSGFRARPTGARSGSPKPRRPPSAAKGGATKRPQRAPAPTAGPSGLECPRCKSALIAGHRAWGCSRWREGCTLVIPFAMGGKRVTETQLRDLVTRGQTRLGTFGAAGKGRLVLREEVRFEPEVNAPGR